MFTMHRRSDLPRDRCSCLPESVKEKCVIRFRLADIGLVLEPRACRRSLRTMNVQQRHGPKPDCSAAMIGHRFVGTGNDTPLHRWVL